MAPDEDGRTETDRLREYLEAELGPGGLGAFEPLAGGNANETFLVRWGDDEYVLRRPPEEQPIPGVLHDVRREYDIMRRLAGTAVAVPEPVAHCTDESILGAEFYLADLVEGDYLSEGVPDRFQSPEYERRLGEEIVDSLVAIHEFDGSDVPIEPAVPPAEYLDHEIERWTDLLERTAEETADERPLPDYDRVVEWLRSNAPEPAATTLVHGDYKPDNIAFGPGTPPEIVAVLDWEMCSVGDPLADLGWLLSYWADPDDEGTTARTYMQDEGFPNRRDLVERYERQTGREFGEGRFYRVLAVFKLAAICEGFYAAHVADSVSSKEAYPAMEFLVPQLLQRAERIIDGAEPI